MEKEYVSMYPGLVASLEKQRKWDIRFLQQARLVASCSKDPSTQTGAIMVDSRRVVVSQGFNGFPQKMPDVPELYANRDEKLSRIIHCEMNALIFAQRDLSGCTLYTWPLASCDRCCVHMLQAGIARFVFPSLPEGPLKARWTESLERTKKFFVETGVAWEEIPHELVT